MPVKILIVDDSLTVRRIISDMLADTGWTVIEALDGNDGLEKLEQNPDCAVIISDINMPWLSGLEMVEQIKQKIALRDIPICIMTTESAQETIDQAKALGVNAYLIKPVQKPALMAVLKNFLS